MLPEISDKNNFDCVPDEVIVRIFKYLDANDLFNIAPVCRRFQRISKDADVWKYVKISDRCNSRLCLHTTNLILQKPISNLDISYFGVKRYTSCPKENLHPSVIVKNRKNSYLTNLKILVLSYHVPKYITTDIENRLKNSPKVKVLTCHLQDPQHVSIIVAARNSVEVLKIPFCDGFDHGTIKGVMESCHKLKELHIRIRIYPYHARLVVDTFPKQLRKLTLIYFDYNFMSLLDDNIITVLASRCPNLVDLNLPYCQITKKSLKTIAEGLKDLERLSLGCKESLDLRELRKVHNLKYLAVGVDQAVPDDLRARVEVSHSVLCLI